MIRRPAVLVCLAAALAAGALSPESSRSAQRKLDRIEQQKLPPGGTVTLSQDEVNSYLRYDFASEVPAGITDPEIRLEPDRVIGTATVDFLEWQAAGGVEPGPLLAWLLRGRRRVETVCRYTSARGYGQVDVESLTIGGVSVPPGTVSFLIENLVRPRYPAAVVGEPVPLGYNLQQVRVEPGRAVIVARR